jgi:hypothetical protein
MYKDMTDRGSIHLTRELFRFETGDDGVRRLFIGSKTNDDQLLQENRGSSISLWHKK